MGRKRSKGGEEEDERREQERDEGGRTRDVDGAESARGIASGGTHLNSQDYDPHGALPGLVKSGL